MFFVHLQIEMKTVVLKISAFLMILWYCFSIIGFDIHTCKGSGETFVATFLSGMTCEDIHPEHRCSEGHCCASSHRTCCSHSGHECTSFENESCCDDDIKVLILTGSRTDDDIRDYSASYEVHCSHVTPYVPVIVTVPDELQILYLHPGGLYGNSGRLSRLQVWRI